MYICHQCSCKNFQPGPCECCGYGSSFHEPTTKQIEDLNQEKQEQIERAAAARICFVCTKQASELYLNMCKSCYEKFNTRKNCNLTAKGGTAI